MRRILSLAALALAVAGCNDVTAADAHGHAEEIVAMRLTVADAAGTTSHHLTDGGVLTPSPLRLPVGTATIGVEFLDEDGAVVDDLHADDYEIRFAGGPSGLAFARTGPFAGTFTAAGTGSGTLEIELFHLEEQHEELGPYFLAVTIGG